MASESRQAARSASRENIRTIVPNEFRGRFSKVGIVALALWPNKPALHLAQATGLSERGAQYLIDGKRKPNARTALALLAEILE